MDTSVREILETYGTTAIAKAMGLPITTVHAWKRKNSLPWSGRQGGLYEMRVQALKAAVASLKKGKKRRAA